MAEDEDEKILDLEQMLNRVATLLISRVLKGRIEPPEAARIFEMQCRNAISLIDALGTRDVDPAPRQRKSDTKAEPAVAPGAGFVAAASAAPATKPEKRAYKKHPNLPLLNSGARIHYANPGNLTFDGRDGDVVKQKGPIILVDFGTYGSGWVGRHFCTVVETPSGGGSRPIVASPTI